MDRQQVIVIRKRTTKSTRTPPNTPRDADKQLGAQRERSSRFIERFRLVTVSSRNTLPGTFDGHASLRVETTAPRRAQTVDLGTGSAPGWSLLSTVLKGRPDTATLQSSIASALTKAGHVEAFIAAVEDCLDQAGQLAERNALDVTTRCRLGDLLHHCRVLQELLAMDEPDRLTPLIVGLLEVAEFDPRRQPEGKLAAAQQILRHLRSSVPDVDAIEKIHIKVDELTAGVAGRKTRRVMDALQRWGLTHCEIDECLKDDDARQAFLHLFDVAMPEPQFRRDSNRMLEVAGFAPILAASSSDFADVAAAVASQGKSMLAVQLLAAHLLGRSSLDDDRDVLHRLLRLCATLWTQVERNSVERDALFRIARHACLLADCGLQRGAQRLQRSIHLLDELRLPRMDGRLVRLHDMSSVCHVLQGVASGGGTAVRVEAILRLAVDVAADCPGWGRSVIERWIRRCDEVEPERWHQAFRDALDHRLDRRVQVEAACSALRSKAFPFVMVRCDDSTAIRWESAPSLKVQGFDWVTHGDEFMNFAHARLDMVSTIDPTEAQQWFDIVRTDLRPKRSGDRAKLLALAMRAIARSNGLLDSITMRDRLAQLASEPRTLNDAIAMCDTEAFQICVELATHRQVASGSKAFRCLQKHLLDSPVFSALITSEAGRQMLDDLLARVEQDPGLLERPAMRALLRRLIDTESERPASRRLLAHPVLCRALLRSDKSMESAVLECLLLLPHELRMSRATEIGFNPPQLLSPLFAPGRRGQRTAVVPPGFDPHLRIAEMGAEMADALRVAARTASMNANSVPLADSLLLLLDAVPGRASTDPREQLQHLAGIVRLTLHLLLERPEDESPAFFRLCPPLGDPAEPESTATSNAMRSLEAQGRAIHSNGEPGLFAFAGLLTCLYLIEDKPLPVTESFEATSLARLMCAALWFDAGHGLRCRQQLSLMQQHAHRVRHWLLTPTWFSSLRAELFDASATLPG